VKISLFYILFIPFLLIGCVGSKKSYTPVYHPDKNNNTEVSESTSQDKRIVIYDASVDLKVKNIDTTNAKIKQIAENNNGYVMSIGNRKTEIRVKASKLNDAINDISRLGKITEKTIYGNDVTDEYYDYNIRLENAKKARLRYLDLLAKAENVEATLKVEKELERLNTEIDSLEGRVSRLKHLSEYSTVTIYFTQKKKLGIIGYIAVGLYKGIKWLIIRG